MLCPFRGTVHTHHGSPASEGTYAHPGRCTDELVVPCPEARR